MKYATAAIVLLVIAPLLNAAPATLPTTTSDGVAYGEAQPIKGFNPPSLPTIGRMLGVPAAEWVGKRKIITRTQSSAEVEKIEKREQPGYTVDNHLPEFVVVEGSGHYEAFDVDHGRIIRVVLRKRPMSDDALEAAAQAINAVGSKLNPLASAYGGGMFGAPLVVSFRADSWLLCVDPPSAKIASAIRNQQVIVGMTEEQADAAMWAYQKQNVETSPRGRAVSYFSEQIVSGGSPPLRTDKCSVEISEGVVSRVMQ